MASSRPSSSGSTPRGSGAPRRGGVVVNTVRRRLRSEAQDEEARRAESASRKRKSKPSKRYRERLQGAERAGGAFYKEAEISKQFEEAVVDLYDTERITNASLRKLSLREQKERDGDEFALPTLSRMCLEMVADTFSTHVLPLRYDQRARTQQVDNKGKSKSSSSSFPLPPIRAPRRKGILGVPIDDEDADEEFTPGREDGTPSPKKPVRHARGAMSQRERRRKEVSQNDNAELLHALQPALLENLQLRLEQKAPHLLTADILSDFFSNHEKVSAKRTFRAVSVKGGISATQVMTLLQRLYYQESSRTTTTTRLVAWPRPNAATHLRLLHLQAFTRLSSAQLRPLFSETFHLEEVCLRGCISVTGDSIRQLVETSGKTLRKINFNWTSIGPSGLEAIVTKAPNVEVLKVAHVRGLTNDAITNMMKEATQSMALEGQVPLGRLQRLKVAGCEMSMAGVVNLSRHCGRQLRSLDISGLKLSAEHGSSALLALLGLDPYANPTWEISDVIRLVPASSNTFNTNLEKLNMAGGEVDQALLESLLRALPRLRGLRAINLNHIDVIPSGPTSLNFRNGLVSGLALRLFGAITLQVYGRLYFNEVLDSASSMEPIEFPVDDTLQILLDRTRLLKSHPFARVAFASHSVVPHLVSSRGCRLGLITSITKYLSQGQESPMRGIRHLDLSGFDFTGLDHDEAILETNPFSKLHIAQPERYLSTSLACESMTLSGSKGDTDSIIGDLGGNGLLHHVDLSQAVISQEAIDEIIDANPYIERLDLTACRAIPVRERRNYLELRRRPEAVKSEISLPVSAASTLTWPSRSPSPIASHEFTQP